MKLILSSFLLFITIFLNAQIKPNGYIVDNINDTIHGTIGYHNEFRCVFTPGGEKKAKEYFINDLKLFRYYDGPYFVVKELLFMDSIQTIYVEYLVNGEVDLWYTYPYYYLQVDADTIVVLTNKEKKVVINEGKKEGAYYKKDNRYMGILNYAMRDYPEISQKTKNVHLDKESLVNLAVDYHEYMCNDTECLIYSKQTNRRKVVLGLGISAGFGNFLSDNNISYMSNLGIETNILIYSDSICRIMVTPFYKFGKYHLKNGESGQYKWDDNNKFYSWGFIAKYKILKSIFSPTCGLGTQVYRTTAPVGSWDEKTLDLSLHAGIIYQFSNFSFITTEVGIYSSKSIQYNLALNFYLGKNNFIK